MLITVLLPITIQYTLLITELVGGVAQWKNVGLWPADFPWPTELDWSNERGVDQDVVSNRDQEDDRQLDQRTCGAPCGQECRSQAEQCVQRLRCDELLGCHLDAIGWHFINIQISK